MGHELVRALRIDRIGAFLHSFGLPHFTQGLIDADRLAFVASTVLLLEIVFWSSIIFYMGLIERWNVFDLQRFAIRRMQSYPSKEKLQECLTDVLLGHFLIRPFVLYISYPYIRNLLVFGLVEIPNPWTILWQFLFCTQVDDFLFYWLHRLSHVGWFYKNIHKRHHEFKHTVAIAVEWAHPVEDIVVNTIPTVVSYIPSIVFLLIN